MLFLGEICTLEIAIFLIALFAASLIVVSLYTGILLPLLITKVTSFFSSVVVLFGLIIGWDGCSDGAKEGSDQELIVFPRV